MTQSCLEWLTGRDDIASRSYDFIAERHFWETRWFRGSVAALFICIIWFFWLGTI